MQGLGYAITDLIQQHYQIKLSHPVPAHVAALLLAMVKLGRAACPGRGRKDNYIDGQNYVQIASEVDPRREGESWADFLSRAEQAE